MRTFILLVALAVQCGAQTSEEIKKQHDEIMSTTEQIAKQIRRLQRNSEIVEAIETTKTVGVKDCRERGWPDTPTCNYFARGLMVIVHENYVKEAK